MKIYEANQTLYDAINLLVSDYSQEQWTKKELIDEMRYAEAEKALDSVKRAIDSDNIDYDEDDWEERERLSSLMYILERKLEEM